MTRRVDLIPDPRERVATEAVMHLRGWSQAAIDTLGDSLDDDEAFSVMVYEARRFLAKLDAVPPQPRKAGPLSGADARVLRLERRADAVAIFAWPVGDGPVEVAVAAGNLTSVGTIDRATAAPVASAAATLSPSRSEPRP